MCLIVLRLILFDDNFLLHNYANDRLMPRNGVTVMTPKKVVGVGLDLHEQTSTTMTKKELQIFQNVLRSVRRVCARFAFSYFFTTKRKEQIIH